MTANVAKRAARRAVLVYSVWSRKRKAAAVSRWLDEHQCESLLFVGTVTTSDPAPNAGIVEYGIAEGRTVKMGINLFECDSPYPFMVADGRDMPFDDRWVDFALANAIIEHVGDEADQRQLVREMTRVARCWVITTPNRWFPVESHTSTLLAHWIPGWRRNRQEFTRLLSLREFKSLLPPGATVVGRPWSATFTAYYDGAAATQPRPVRR